MSEKDSWLPIPKDSDFSIWNLPYGIFSTQGTEPRVGVAIGNHIIDLAGVVRKGLIQVDLKVVEKDSLNAFIGLGKEKTIFISNTLRQFLTNPDSVLRSFPELLIKKTEATMHLPIEIGDYTDFYSSIEHATNVGKMFRDPKNALLPNWKHLPVGYHGRSSSIVLSGTPIHRPQGQVLPQGAEQPVFQLSNRLDFELEMAFIIGKETQLGEVISTQKAEDYIFGMVLFNDWSARDIQKWEYVPLGPFLGKNFASSISPWVVTLEALEPFRTAGPVQNPQVLPYLQYEGDKNYDISLEVAIQPKNGETQAITHSNFKYLYWNMVQQLTHHTVNGCNIRIGDMMASGTISGKEKNTYGSMLELTWSGKNPLTMKDGSTRVFIQDYDTVTMQGYAEKNNKRVGFGEVQNQVLPAYMTKLF